MDVGKDNLRGERDAPGMADPAAGRDVGDPKLDGLFVSMSVVVSLWYFREAKCMCTSQISAFESV